MNQVEHAYRVFGFVALQMSDEMPLNVHLNKLVELFTGFLYIVFTDDLSTGGDGFTDALHRLGFSHGHESYCLRRAAAFLGRIRYALL